MLKTAFPLIHNTSTSREFVLLKLEGKLDTTPQTPKKQEKGPSDTKKGTECLKNHRVWNGPYKMAA